MFVFPTSIARSMSGSYAGLAPTPVMSSAGKPLREPPEAGDGSTDDRWTVTEDGNLELELGKAGERRPRLLAIGVDERLAQPQDVDGDVAGEQDAATLGPEVRRVSGRVSWRVERPQSRRAGYLVAFLDPDVHACGFDREVG